MCIQCCQLRNFVLIVSNFWRVRINSEKRLLASSCLSVRMYQRGAHWTYLRQI
jgi:hypothetical protein